MRGVNIEEQERVDVLANRLFLKCEDDEWIEVTTLLIFEIEGLNMGQCPGGASLSARAAFEAVENSKELLLILEGNHIVFVLPAIIQYFIALLQLRNKEGTLHLLLLILLKLKSLEVECLEEVLHRHLTPVLIGMYLFNALQLTNLKPNLILE